jgi:hypothetical protein
MAAAEDEEAKKNRRDMPASAPWIVQTSVYVLERVAPWPLMLGVLLAVMTGWFPFPVLVAVNGFRADVAKQREDIAGLAVLIKARDVALTKFSEIQGQTLDVQRVVCWNVSKTTEEQRRCYRPTPTVTNEGPSGDRAMTKDELLALLDDLEVRAKILALVDTLDGLEVRAALRAVRPTAAIVADPAPEPDPALAGPGWLREMVERLPKR